MTLPSVQAQLLKNEVLRYASRSHHLLHVLTQYRVQIGSVFMHLAVNGSTPQLRRDTLSALERLSTTFPEVVNRVARDALVTFISKEDQAKFKTASSDDSQDDRAPVNRQMRLSSLLYTCATFGDDTDVGLKQRLLADLVIIAHHAGVCRSFPCSFEKFVVHSQTRARWQFKIHMDRAIPKGRTGSSSAGGRSVG
jgi:hypothetical protein